MLYSEAEASRTGNLYLLYRYNPCPKTSPNRNARPASNKLACFLSAATALNYSHKPQIRHTHNSARQAEEQAPRFRCIKTYKSSAAPTIHDLPGPIYNSMRNKTFKCVKGITVRINEVSLNCPTRDLLSREPTATMSSPVSSRPFHDYTIKPHARLDSIESRNI